MCIFAQDDVQTYRRTDKGLEGLYPKATSILSELMLVLSHAAPAFEADGILVELTAALQSCRGFAAYLADDWDVWLTELRDKESAVAAEENLSALIDRVLRRLGLQIEDLADGNLFVGVVQPVFCATGEDP